MLEEFISPVVIHNALPPDHGVHSTALLGFHKKSRLKAHHSFFLEGKGLSVK